MLDREPFRQSSFMYCNFFSCITQTCQSAKSSPIPFYQTLFSNLKNFKFRKCYFLIATHGELLLLLSLGCTPICLNSDETCHDFTKPVFPNMTWAQVHYFWRGDSELRLDCWRPPTVLTEYEKVLFGEKITP